MVPTAAIISACGFDVDRICNYLREASVDDPIQAAAKDLVPHQDSEVEVRDCHCTVVLDRVWPMTRRSEADADHIERERNSEEFPGE